MLNLLELAALRVDGVEMPAPARRVLTHAVAARLGPVQDELDAAPYPASSLGFGRPDRIKHLGDLGRADRADGQATDQGRCIGGQRGPPLLAVHWVAPSAFVVGDVEFGRLVERDAAGLLKALAGFPSVTGLYRVLACFNHLTG